MSIFSSIGKALKGAVGGFLTGGPVGAVIGGAGAIAGSVLGGGGGGRVPPSVRTAGGMQLPPIGRGTIGGVRSLPGMGQVRLPPINIRKALPTVAKVAGGAAAAKFAYDAYGNLVQVKRRRRKGITASELKGFKRVACILRDYQKVATKTHVKAPARRSRVCA